jgi:hypothetical protein
LPSSAPPLEAQARDWRPGAALAQALTTEPRATAAAVPRGSGFCVVPGRIVTSEHLVAGCAQVMVGGQRSTALAADAVNDLAVLEVPGDRGAATPLRPTAARLGEAVTIAGFPLAGLLAGASATSGNVSRLSGLVGDTGQLQISAPVQLGNSGGPVLDAAGQVIGMVVSKPDAAGVATGLARVAAAMPHDKAPDPEDMRLFGAQREVKVARTRSLTASSNHLDLSGRMRPAHRRRALRRSRVGGERHDCTSIQYRVGEPGWHVSFYGCRAPYWATVSARPCWATDARTVACRCWRWRLAWAC